MTPFTSILAIVALTLGAAQAQAQSNPADFQSCLSRLRASVTQTPGSGITTATFDRAMANVEYDATINELLNNQPEFRIQIGRAHV